MTNAELIAVARLLTPETDVFVEYEGRRFPVKQVRSDVQADGEVALTLFTSDGAD